jgi:hypothetical protein
LFELSQVLCFSVTRGPDSRALAPSTCPSSCSGLLFFLSPHSSSLLPFSPICPSSFPSFSFSILAVLRHMPRVCYCFPRTRGIVSSLSFFLSFLSCNP